jgi:hypothetical protein
VKLESPTGLKGSKKTRRAIAQGDIDKALAARDKAMESPQGRRTMRLMGATKKVKDESKPDKPTQTE